MRDQGELRDAWYLPWAQNAGSGVAGTIHLMLRSGQDPAALDRQVAGIDGLLPVVETAAMPEVREKSISRERVGAGASRSSPRSACFSPAWAAVPARRASAIEPMEALRAS